MGEQVKADRRPTIIEVARLAGVSHQTVSRYLRSEDGMKPATRELVSAAIAELEYRPNLVARAMRDRRTGRLALLLPAGNATGSLELLTGASAAANAAGYGVEVVTLGGPVQSRSERVLELADSAMFEGIVSLTPLPDSVLSRPPGRTRVIVSPDYDEQMRGIGELAESGCIAEFVERLAADGHRVFLHLAGDLGYTTARQRMELFLETVERLGLESAGVVGCHWSGEEARLAIRALPATSRVTAVIGANDVIAAGAIRGAQERGWRVPEDLSVTGWDNHPVTAVVMPSMTTVAMDFERVGRRAVARLLAVLGDEAEPVDDEPITRAIWRESTGPSRRDGVS